MKFVFFFKNKGDSAVKLEQLKSSVKLIEFMYFFLQERGNQ